MGRNGAAFELVRIGADIVLFLGREADHMPLQQQLLTDIVWQYEMKVTLSMGDTYEQARDASLYKIVYGADEVLLYDQVVSGLSNDFEYPFDKHEGLLEAVRLHKTEQIEPILDELFAIFKTFSYPVIMLSIIEYLTELRIRKANEYLIGSQMPVKEVGEKVGFLNPSYFVTWYKKHTGFAPTEYRRQRKALP